MPFSGVIVPDVLAQGQFANSNATLYTAPTTASGGAGNMAIVKEIIIANCDSSDHTYTLYRVPAGGSAADSRAMFKTITILANTTERIGLSLPLRARYVAGTLTGDTLEGFADTANKVTYTISGAEVT